jgi:hypothetical protein
MKIFRASYSIKKKAWIERLLKQFNRIFLAFRLVKEKIIEYTALGETAVLPDSRG